LDELAEKSKVVIKNTINRHFDGKADANAKFILYK
jgi:hypothetical protein